MKMIEATVTKVLPRKMGKNFDIPYSRVSFRCANGLFWQTDVVPSFRNYADWREKYEVGNRLGSLRVLFEPDGKKPGKIHGDSKPVLLESAQATHSQVELF